MRTGNILEDIKIIISGCEEVQNSLESAYTKEKAKLSAYEEILELIGGIDEAEK